MRSMATMFRTRLVWLLMRLVSHERLFGGTGAACCVRWKAALLRGDLAVRGGMGARTRLGAAPFAPRPAPS